MPSFTLEVGMRHDNVRAVHLAARGARVSVDTVGVSVDGVIRTLS